MVLPDAERIQVEIVGQDRFFDDVAEHASLWVEGAVRRCGNIPERIEVIWNLLPFSIEYGPGGAHRARGHQ
jgi:hypothetical protein